MPDLSASRSEFAGLAAEILAGGHALRFRARGTSMHPFVKDGDLVEVRPIGASAVRRGDVVLCFPSGGRVVVHRIVRVSQGRGGTAVLLQGDALSCPDGVLPLGEVLGRVAAIERAGRRSELSAGLPRLWSNLSCGLAPCSRWFFRSLAVLQRSARWLEPG